MTRKYHRGISEAQANALALERRGRTYADENAKSWEIRFGQRDRPMSTKALVTQLAILLAEEVPTKLHEGPDKIDEGGVPAMTGAFEAYLESSAMSVTYREPKVDSQGRELRPVMVGTFRKPVQAAIEGMKRCGGRTAWWGRIAERVVIGSEAPVSAARSEGSHEFEAVRTANEALSELYRRVTPDKMDLARTRSAA